MGNFKKVLIYILASVPFIFLGYVVWHAILLEQQLPTKNGFQYVNKKYAISLGLSQGWERTYKIIDQLVMMNNQARFRLDDNDLRFILTWNYFNTTSRNLLEFVKQLAMDTEQGQQIKTERIFELSNNEKGSSVVWIGTRVPADDYFEAYYTYIKDPNNNFIDTFIFSASRNFSDFQRQKVVDILKSVDGV